MVRIFAMVLLSWLAACASIPHEAPELSVQLGSRISEMQAAHNRLLEEFFAEKRLRVEEYVRDVWVPTFAREFFATPGIDTIWNQVVKSPNPQDRVKFIVLVGPRLQSKINSKTQELIQPLDELERTIRSRLTGDYDQMKAINGTLTSFLASASKVEENRERFLAMLGVKQSDLDNVVSDADAAVSKLVDVTHNVQDRLKDADTFKQDIEKLVETARGH